MHNMPQRPEAARIKRYRRFHGYDYSRGASIFVTFALKERLPLLAGSRAIRWFYRPQAGPH